MESLALTTYLNFSGILLGLRKNKNVIHEKEVCIEGTVFFTSKTKQVFFFFTENFKVVCDSLIH